MLRALGNPARYRIVRYLTECPECIVNEIVQQTPLAQSTVSQHLRVLREAGLVCGEIEGPAMNYCLDREALDWLIEHLRHLAEAVPDRSPRDGVCCP
jgi:ArsR family transcriptional regulator, arsenate/arsenite/antimonite-responsive transcriptional repressor